MDYINHNAPMIDLEESLDYSGIITYALNVPSRMRALSVATIVYTNVTGHKTQWCKNPSTIVS